jgi:hypothetical protein
MSPCLRKITIHFIPNSSEIIRIDPGIGFIFGIQQVVNHQVQGQSFEKPGKDRIIDFQVVDQIRLKDPVFR